MLFGQVLRRLGLGFGSGELLDLVRAADYVSIGRRQDFYYAARCLLVHRRQDLPLFDDAFKVFWRRPAHGVSTRELRSMGEERRYRTPRIGPPSGADGEGAPGSSDPQPVVELNRTYSAQEVLRAKDFAEYTPAEISQARHLLTELAWDPGQRTTRRLDPGSGEELDFRRSLRNSLRFGGELLDLSHLQPRTKPRNLVLICDVSGSMERYTRMLLHFAHTIAAGLGRVEAFLFATRLTRITRHLRYRSVDQAVNQVSRSVPDWAGGTRIGDTLKTFNYQWARRVLRSSSVVLVVSDGWDRGEPDLLSREMHRLQRSCHRLIWLNPLLGAAGYQPLTQGMQAALPYADDFLPVHNLNSLEALARCLSQMSPHRKPTTGRRRAREDFSPSDGESGQTPRPRHQINPGLASMFQMPPAGPHPMH